MGENGERIVDQRPTLIIMDVPNSFWPLIVTMDADTAAACVKDLRAAASR